MLVGVDEGDQVPVADRDAYLAEWGIDLNYQEGSGLVKPEPHTPPRQLYLLQRSQGKLGAKLGKTTGWIHRAQLKRGAVEMLSGVSYEGVDEVGLRVKQGEQSRVLEVDHVVVCAGQLPNRDLYTALEGSGLSLHLVGGSREAGELDAKRAIRQGLMCALEL